MTITTRFKFLDDAPVISHAQLIVMALTKLGRQNVLIREGPLMSKALVVEVTAPSSTEIHRASIDKNLSTFQTKSQLRILDTIDVRVPWLDKNAFNAAEVAKGVAKYIDTYFDSSWPIVVWEHWRLDVNQILKMTEFDDDNKPVTVTGNGMLLTFYISGHVADKSDVEKS